jgi:hypothetical protein
MFGGKTKVTLDPAIYERAAKHAAKVGYATVDEFVAHVLERELRAHEEQLAKEKVLEKMKGLGYLT